MSINDGSRSASPRSDYRRDPTTVAGDDVTSGTPYLSTESTSSTAAEHGSSSSRDAQDSRINDLASELSVTSLSDHKIPSSIRAEYDDEKPQLPQRPGVSRVDTDNFGDIPSVSPLPTPGEELRNSPYGIEHGISGSTDRPSTLKDHSISSPAVLQIGEEQSKSSPTHSAAFMTDEELLEVGNSYPGPATPASEPEKHDPIKHERDIASYPHMDTSREPTSLLPSPTGTLPAPPTSSDVEHEHDDSEAKTGVLHKIVELVSGGSSQGKEKTEEPEHDDIPAATPSNPGW